MMDLRDFEDTPQKEAASVLSNPSLSAEIVVFSVCMPHPTWGVTLPAKDFFLDLLIFLPL